MKLRPVDPRNARHVMIVMTFMAATCFFGALGNGLRGRPEPAVHCLIAMLAFGLSIGFIEWRFRRDGFDAICEKARKLNASQRADLVKVLTQSNED